MKAQYKIHEPKNLKGIFRILPILAFLLAGCEDSSRVKVVQKQEANPTRFVTQYMGFFQASAEDRANHRSIYLITDSKTKVEYLAVEGCGTAQLVDHGKQGLKEE